MTANPFPTIDLVPGDDWAGRIDIVDAEANPLDLTGWMVTVFEVRWAMGAVALQADLGEAAMGRVGFAATETDTAPLPLGTAASIVLKMRSPAGVDETLYVAPVRGVRVATDVSVSVVRAGIQGPPGRTFHAVDSSTDLEPDFGQDGDTAIILTNGAEFAKEAGRWSPTGRGFWGTLLEDAEQARDGAVAAHQATLAALADVTGLEATLAALSGGKRDVVSATDVVDLFVYDTRLDSDGGAWRHRCASTTWHREQLDTTKRGPSRAFPQIALLVAHPSALTIYDLDRPECPMWMVIDAGAGFPLDGAGSINAVSALNGIVAIATGPTTGLVEIDFVSDVIAGRRTGTTGHAVATIGDRHTANADVAGHWQDGLAGAQINGVDMSIMPGTQADPSRGLPTPVMDVMTDAGTSRVHASGVTCTLSAAAGDAHATGATLTDGTLAVANVTQGRVELFDQQSSWADGAVPQAVLSDNSDLTLLAAVAASDRVVGMGDDLAIGQATGLNLVKREPGAAPAAICHVTESYLTGFQVGDTRLALAESIADTSDLVGAIARDTFETEVPPQWQENGAANAVVDGSLEVTNTIGWGSSYRQYPVIAGRPVRISGFVRRGTAVRYAVRIHDGAFSDLIVEHILGTHAAMTPFEYAFVPSQPFVTVQIQVEDPETGRTVYADDILIEGSGTDRSGVENAPLIAGVLNREPVAEDADLAAYAGFSETDYLQWLPSAAFDFGTGDFAIYGWVKVDQRGSVQTIVDHDSSSSGARFTLDITAAGAARFTIDSGANPVVLYAGVPLVLGRWHFVVAGVDADNAVLWVDAKRVAMAPAPGSVSNALAVLRLGQAVSGGSALMNGQVALWRVGATMPTEQQIVDMFTAEQQLMRKGAECLLPDSNVVTLSHDAAHGVLHVATDQGTARYAGLERVEDRAAVGLVHAVSGTAATFDGSRVTADWPALTMRSALLDICKSIGHGRGASVIHGSTADAAPTIIARLHLPVGEGICAITTQASAGSMGQASFEDGVHVRRSIHGDVQLVAPSVQRTIARTIEGFAVSIGIDTVHQSLIVTATGLTDTHVHWQVRIKNTFE